MATKKITFTGDIMCKKEFIDQWEKDGSVFESMFSDIAPFLKESDYVVGNLETPLAGEEMGYTAASFCFNSPDAFGEAVKHAGIDFVSTANNHCLDRGIAGLIRTNQALDRMGFDHAGTRNTAGDTAGTIIRIGNVRVGMMAYTYGTEAASNHVWLNKDEQFHVNLLQDQELSFGLWRKMYMSRNKWIRYAYKLIATAAGQRHHGNPSDRKENDTKQKKEILKEMSRLRAAGAELIVISFHAGGQYNLHPEKRVKRYVDFLFKNGADLVVVNHEHRVQEAVFMNNSRKQAVTYCLGNFLGGAGVYYPPFDKTAEYSVLLHMYLSDDLQTSYTFTVCKTVMGADQVCRVVRVCDLYDSLQDENERKKLQKENTDIYNIFTGRHEASVEIAPEYACG